MPGDAAMRRQVLVIASSLDNANRCQQVLSGLEADMVTGSARQIARIAAPEEAFDLVIHEARGTGLESLQDVVPLVERRGFPLLAIVDEEDAGKIALPAGVPSDFMVHGAGQAECAVRIRRLLGDAGPHARAETVTVGNMVVNLSAYQVTVGDEPIDFTYLEYALLVFLVQHPDRTFTRDALLRNVWGMDYYGGSRTVDVHVRRIRAKLGPNLARHLETIRSVGYYWSSR